MGPAPTAALVLLWSTQFSGTAWVSLVLNKAPEVMVRHEILPVRDAVYDNHRATP